MLLFKIEDFRQASVKKFADRIEVSKNYKYLDLNLKQVLEQVMKKNEKGDNWLLAKKPFGGNSCASCEAYIGDLQDNREYVPWNKFKVEPVHVTVTVVPLTATFVILNYIFL